jgi:biotin operon repressor
MKKERDPILEIVFKHYGNSHRLSKALGCSRQNVHSWQQIPLKHVKRISEETGISRDQLRPDIYGP